MAKVHRKEHKAKKIRVWLSDLIRCGRNWSKEKLVWFSLNFINGSKTYSELCGEMSHWNSARKLKKKFVGLSSGRDGTH